MNPILLTDSYKPSHWRQYPPDTTHIYSYFESRGSQHYGTQNLTWFGLQYILKKHLEGVRVTDEHIEEAKDLFAAHFGTDTIFNERGWRIIVDEHGGRFPVEIRALPEGMIVESSLPLMTIVNTDPRLFWLTNYLETLLCQVWYPFTVATSSGLQRRDIQRYLEETGDPAGVAFKLHDFGFRGSTSVESASIGGAAHLVHFQGTDTIPALILLRDYYNAKMAGFSIPAAEHSTITSWGGAAFEVEAFKNMLEQFPTGLVAVVSDSYDIFSACEHLWGEQLKDRVLARDGCLVVRPDSGELPGTVLMVLEKLGKAFGKTTNAKGYQVLDPHVRVIQGDGINRAMVIQILQLIKQHGWSTDNLAFGSGGGLLQNFNRDTLQCAFKCSAIKRAGTWRSVSKSPVTDKQKRSKAGRFGVFNNDGVLTWAALPPGHDTFTKPTHLFDEDENLLQPVFRNGELLHHYSLDEVRERAQGKLQGVSTVA